MLSYRLPCVGLGRSLTGRLKRLQYRCSFSSVEDTVVSADDAAVKLDASTTTKQLPKVPFPWRHETMDNMLPRLLPGTPEKKYDIGPPPTGQTFVANTFLNVPTWKTFFGFDWRGELAHGASYAFGQGVAGIVSNVFRVPIVDINNGEGLVRFSYPPNEGMENRQADDFCPVVDRMLDKPLRELYQSAHEHGRNHLQIRLELEPKRGVFYSLFCLPFVTRSAIEVDPSLRDRVRLMMASLREDYGKGYKLGFEFFFEQLQKDILTTTVDMQVLVECDEVFQVRDKASGVLLQGSEDGLVRRVQHLVRLETTATTTFRGYFPHDAKIDNWIITDIDDLLGPKKWYHDAYAI